MELADDEIEESRMLADGSCCIPLDKFVSLAKDFAQGMKDPKIVAEGYMEYGDESVRIFVSGVRKMTAKEKTERDASEQEYEDRLQKQVLLNKLASRPLDELEKLVDDGE